MYKISDIFFKIDSIYDEKGTKTDWLTEVQVINSQDLHYYYIAEMVWN